MTLVLVRHAPVAERYRSLCYGRSDVELDETGLHMSRAVARQLAPYSHADIVHSGLLRTRVIAEFLAAECDVKPRCCPELQERDFGEWEMRPWNALFAAHGDEMLRMVTEPETFRPGGGETTLEMRDRVVGWCDALPEDRLTIAITHGGPIAALLGTWRNLPVAEWIGLIPACGETIWVEGRRVGLSETPLRVSERPWLQTGCKHG
jgi:broad specificity phosphatase PhoE